MCDKCKKMLLVIESLNTSNQRLLDACNTFEKTSSDSVEVWEALRELYHAVNSSGNQKRTTGIENAMVKCAKFIPF